MGSIWRTFFYILKKNLHAPYLNSLFSLGQVNQREAISLVKARTQCLTNCLANNNKIITAVRGRGFSAAMNIISWSFTLAHGLADLINGVHSNPPYFGGTIPNFDVKITAPLFLGFVPLLCVVCLKVHVYVFAL